jgi:NCS2 family nucleobase:cation symporter-2
MIFAGLFPPIGAFFASLPEAVLGGCTIMMFGSIVISGVQMLTRCEFTQRNITIASLSIAIGVGFTQVPDLFKSFPMIIREVFAANSVAVTFVVSIFLNLILPKSLEIERVKSEDTEIGHSKR